MSIHPYEHHRLRRNAAALLDACFSGRCRAPFSRIQIAVWLADCADDLGLPAPLADAARAVKPDDPVTGPAWLALAPALDVLPGTGRPPAASPLERRMRWLARILPLEPIDAAILGLLVRSVSMIPYGKLLGWPGTVDRILRDRPPVVLGWLLKEAPERIRKRLVSAAPLRSMGLLGDDDDPIVPSSIVTRVVEEPSGSVARLRTALFGAPAAATLEWQDFDYLGDAADLAHRLLDAALGKSEKGVNILLHGAPGTGKTEFAKTLGNRLKARVIFVGECDEWGGEPNRAERIAAYVLARALAQRDSRTVLIVDEADDIFAGIDTVPANGWAGSKVFLHRLVESASAPTIWITNRPGRLGHAVLRRMMLGIGFPQPNRAARTRVAGRALSRHRLVLPYSDIARIGALEVSPAVLDQSIRAACLIGGGAGEIEQTAGSVRALLAGRPVPPAIPVSPVAFDPTLSAADTDLVRLAERVVNAGRTDISFCLYGLPGTGKSAFARHLARRLGMDVIQKRGSDLFGPYVGETERNIARTFSEAADQRAMLVLDEVDALLADRRDARHSWERSQVDEMLTWMERHPYPLACTTNLMEALDPATLRRFVFKIRFLPLTRTQARELFRQIFFHEPPRALDGLWPLAPGDFAVVARRAAIMGESHPERLSAMLAEEVAAKPEGQKRPVGFKAA